MLGRRRRLGKRRALVAEELKGAAIGHAEDLVTEIPGLEFRIGAGSILPEHTGRVSRVGRVRTPHVPEQGAILVEIVAIGVPRDLDLGRAVVAPGAIDIIAACLLGWDAARSDPIGHLCLAEDTLPLVGIHIRVEAVALIGAVEVDGQDVGPAAEGRRGRARDQLAAVLDDDVLRPEIDLAAFPRRFSEFQRAAVDDVDIAVDIAPGSVDPAFLGDRQVRLAVRVPLWSAELLMLQADLAVAGAVVRPGGAACEQGGRQSEQESCQQGDPTLLVPNRDELHGVPSPC
jgi:hypothetical protein